MLLDSAGLWFRAFYAIPEKITAPDGTPVNAIRGFCDMLAALVQQRRPSRLVACLDLDWRPAWRVELLPSYKTHRLDLGGPPGAEDTPDPLAAQIPAILEILHAFGIATAGAPDYEADDIIGTLATRGPSPVEVVTGDRDLFQLTDDAAGVSVVYIGRGIAKLVVMDDAGVREKYGVPPSGYADMAVLRGDPSDGLPGVAGIGDKTAAGLISRYGSVERLIEAIDDDGDTALGRTHRGKLAAARDYLVAAAKVVRVVRDIDLPVLDDAIPAEPADPEALEALAKRWGVANSIKRLRTALAEATA
ncbi:5'-3' exonuclease [Fodinicola acaciae]|uniref:5'-3' exonuclease n=1 Tax=Fodinicola acaciae TaxID=2681555 RepID=UPI001FE891CC|nr:5'-3' exonuclease H3TH domain-containing protein [Fodinicola acaciae]